VHRLHSALDRDSPVSHETSLKDWLEPSKKASGLSAATLVAEKLLGKL